MLNKYFQFKAWADERTMDAMAKITMQKDSFAFALQQLNHMVIVEELFQARLLAKPEPHDKTNTTRLPSFEELVERKIILNQWYASFIEEVEVEQLNQHINFRFKDGQNGRMSCNEILFHILTHGSYHRGNIARELDLAGAPHPVDGFGMYIHAAEPERRV